MLGRRILLLLAFVIVAVLSFTTLIPRDKNVSPVQGMVITSAATAPFNTIYLFYHGLAVNDWPGVRRLTTAALWSRLQEFGIVAEWEARRRADPTLDFSLFLVKACSVDTEQGTAWVLGEAQWTGARAKPPDTVQTVFLQQTEGWWRVTRVDDYSAAEATDDFYQAIQDGNWFAMRYLTEPRYWERLIASGTIAALQKDWVASRTGVYVVIHVRDLVQKETKAWVSADVLWRPLSIHERETPVLVELTKTKEGEAWQIARIYGHWEESK